MWFSNFKSRAFNNAISSLIKYYSNDVKNLINIVLYLKNRSFNGRLLLFPRLNYLILFWKTKNGINLNLNSSLNTSYF